LLHDGRGNPAGRSKLGGRAAFDEPSTLGVSSKLKFRFEGRALLTLDAGGVETLLQPEATSPRSSPSKRTDRSCARFMENLFLGLADADSLKRG
jgi:hypothetical protein